MSYICPNCANKERFYRDDSITQYGTETRHIDELGDIQDYDGFNVDDDETTEYGDVMCSDCDSEADDVTDDEWEEWNGPDIRQTKVKNWRQKYDTKNDAKKGQ